MKNDNDPIVQATPDQRRRFLRLFGTAAALIPITAITGCADEAPPPPPSREPADASESTATTESAPEAMMEDAANEAEAMVDEAVDEVDAAMDDAADAMEDAADEAESMMDEAAEEMDAAVEEVTGDSMAGDMPPVDLNDPTAQSLGYKHDAANVDAARYPNRDPAHRCANCILYQGAEGSEWGGCALFPGKSVNASGWCSSYTPKAG